MTTATAPVEPPEVGTVITFEDGTELVVHDIYENLDYEEPKPTTRGFLPYKHFRKGGGR